MDYQEQQQPTTPRHQTFDAWSPKSGHVPRSPPPAPRKKRSAIALAPQLILLQPMAVKRKLIFA